MGKAAACIVLAAATVLPCWGCKTNEGPHIGSTVPVKGKITYQGKPISQGRIIFEPTDASRPAHGTINKDGTFELSTFKHGDGAVPGTHRITVEGAGRSVRTNKITEVEITAEKSDYAIELK